MRVTVPQERVEDRPHTHRPGVPQYIRDFEDAWDRGDPTPEQVVAFFRDVVNNGDEEHLAARERRVLTTKRFYGEVP